MPRLRGVTLTAVLGTFLLATTACGGGDDEESADDGNARESTTTTAAPTTTVEAIGPPEWVDVVRDLQQRIYELESDPNPDLVPTIWSEEGPDYQGVLENAQELHEAGQHYVGDPKQVVFVAMRTPDDTENPTLTVRYTRPPWQLLDENDNVVEEFPGAGPGNCTSLNLTRDGPDGSYRVWSDTPLDGCPEEAR
jgi:hypothetical protein